MTKETNTVKTVKAVKAVEAVEVEEWNLKDKFMAQVDVALGNVYALYERKSLSKEEIQAIVNSILR